MQYDVVRMLPIDIQGLFEQFKYKSDAEKLWLDLASYIGSDPREFFVSWTDHGIAHIEKVFENAGNLISQEALQAISYEDVFCLYTSVLIHDIAMRFNYDTVARLLTSEEPRYKPFQSKWDSFCSEIQHWDEDYLRAAFGEKAQIPNTFKFSKLKAEHFFLVGEFLRRAHGDLCVVLVETEFRLLYHDPSKNPFQGKYDGELRRLLKMSAMIARSHTTNLREGIASAKAAFGVDPTNHNTILSVHYPYLMAIIRIADYLDFRNSSSQYFIKESARITSPISQLEHKTMEACRDPNWESKNMEEILVEYGTVSPDVFAHVNTYMKGIQMEPDTSWAVLSEYYSGSAPSIALHGLTARRIKARNLDSVELEKKYYHDALRITVSDASIIFLLAGPLYGYDSNYALREILSNAHDACLDINVKNDTHLLITLDEKKSVLTFGDQGQGMSIEDLSMYFLRVGGRIRSTLDWKVKNVRRHGKVDVSYAYTSRFGVGVVSLFMLGEDIQISTKKDNHAGVRLSILPHIKELIAEKWDGSRGTQIAVKVNVAIRAKLLRITRSAVELDYFSDKPSDEMAYVRSVLDILIHQFRFVPFDYNLDIKVQESKKALSGTLPSISTLLTFLNRKWCEFTDSKGRKYRCCIFQLSQHDSYRGLTTSSIGQSVVYNGIPVVVPEFAVKKGVQSRDLIVIIDYQNDVRFNLQKTELEELNPALVQRCYEEQYTSRLDLNPIGKDHLFISSDAPDAALRYDCLERLRLTTHVGSKPHVVNGFLPLTFFRGSKVHSLTSKAVRTIESQAFILFGVHWTRVADFMSRLPKCLSFILFSQFNDDESRFAPVPVYAESVDLVTIDGGGNAKPDRNLIRSLANNLTTSERDAMEVVDFLSEVADRHRDKGVSGVFVVRSEDLLRYLDTTRYQLRDVVWSRDRS